MASSIKTCPICEKRFEPEGYETCCSQQCKSLDLSNWLSESYNAGVAEDQSGSMIPDSGGDTHYVN